VPGIGGALPSGSGSAARHRPGNLRHAFPEKDDAALPRHPPRRLPAVREGMTQMLWSAGATPDELTAIIHFR